MRDWADLILRIGREHGYWGEREIVTTAGRMRPGASEVMALRVGFEKLHRETGWEPLVSWEEGVRQTIDWYARNRGRWIDGVNCLTTGRPAVGAGSP
jgi:dTDP-glucose 4,6-dehydratase